MTTLGDCQAIIKQQNQQITALQKQIQYLTNKLAIASIVEKEFLLPIKTEEALTDDDDILVDTRIKLQRGQLTKQNVDLEIGDYAETRLMWAFWRANFQLIEQLLDLGADFYHRNQFGQGPLTYWNIKKESLTDRYLKIIQLCYDRGLKLDQNSSGVAPVTWESDGLPTPIYGPLAQAKKCNNQALLNKFKQLGYQIPNQMPLSPFEPVEI